jgi:hypothetical protein
MSAPISGTRRWVPLALAVTVSTSGCLWGDWGEGGEPITPPSVDDVSLPAWPPMNGEAELQIRVSDDRALGSVVVQFLNLITKPASGTQDTIVVTGEELGEGMGSLFVQVMDVEGGWASRQLTDLVVDLSPPHVDLGKTVLRAADDVLEMWVSDAWVLGSVRLEAGGAFQEHVFDAVYPATLGEAWDYSLVQFPTEGLPIGARTATLEVRDAAGNATVTTFDLTIDGNAPAVSVQAPRPGASVSGAFEVRIAAEDDLGGPVWLDVEVDGTPLATATGPAAQVGADAAELAAGAATLRVYARDEAGNVSVTEVPIVVE